MLSLVASAELGAVQKWRHLVSHPLRDWFPDGLDVLSKRGRVDGHVSLVLGNRQVETVVAIGSKPQHDRSQDLMAAVTE